jgi:hypothetical protein
VKEKALEAPARAAKAEKVEKAEKAGRAAFAKQGPAPRPKSTAIAPAKDRTDTDFEEF